MDTAKTLLPAGSRPFGIAIQGNSAWVADQGRQKLTRIKTASHLVAPTLTISASGSDAVLIWDAVGSAQGYEVWRGTLPYFEPGDANSELLGTPSTPGWTDDGALADDASWYYVVRAVAGGLTSASSNRVGEFPFALTPGTP